MPVAVGFGVTLGEGWVHRVSDLSDHIQVRVVSIADSSTRDGDTTRYSGGVFRSIVTEGVDRSLALRISWVSREDHSRLSGWVGQKVLYRDSLGKFMYGVFYSISTSETPVLEQNTRIPGVTLQLRYISDEPGVG